MGNDSWVSGKYFCCWLGVVMTFDGNIDMLQMAFWQIILAAAPVLLIALAIGRSKDIPFFCKYA